MQQAVRFLAVISICETLWFRALMQILMLLYCQVHCVLGVYLRTFLAPLPKRNIGRVSNSQLWPESDGSRGMHGKAEGRVNGKNVEAAQGFQKSAPVAVPGCEWMRCCFSVHACRQPVQVQRDRLKPRVGEGSRSVERSLSSAGIVHRVHAVRCCRWYSVETEGPRHQHRRSVRDVSVEYQVQLELSCFVVT